MKAITEMGTLKWLQHQRYSWDPKGNLNQITFCENALS